MAERVMVIAAHPDDETFGMGATIAKHRKVGDPVSVVVLADGIGSRGFSKEMIEERHGMCRRACKILGTEDVWLHQYADNQMDTLALLTVTKHIETHIERFKPTAVYTHWRGDLNIDHQVAHNATNVACRPQPWSTVKQVFYFEIPCSTTWGDGFAPQHFVDASEDCWQQKLGAVSCYEKELRAAPHARSLNGIETLGAWRGRSVGIDRAEAFMVGRIVA